MPKNFRCWLRGTFEEVEPLAINVEMWPCGLPYLRYSVVQRECGDIVVVPACELEIIHDERQQ